MARGAVDYEFRAGLAEGCGGAVDELALVGFDGQGNGFFRGGGGGSVGFAHGRFWGFGMFRGNAVLVCGGVCGQVSKESTGLLRKGSQ